jgi:hypothetical protein
MLSVPLGRGGNKSHLIAQQAAAPQLAIPCGGAEFVHSMLKCRKTFAKVEQRQCVTEQSVEQKPRALENTSWRQLWEADRHVPSLFQEKSDEKWSPMPCSSDCVDCVRDQGFGARAAQR